MQLMGALLSPYVRKTTLFLEEKGLSYEALDRIGPHDKDKTFRKASPLGKIPALVDGDFGIADSSIICAYLEKKYPENPLYPNAADDYARALFIEEYADTALMTETGSICLQMVIGPLAFKQPTNQDKLDKAMQGLPSRLDHLDELLEANEEKSGSALHFVGANISIADITIASHINNLDICDVSINETVYPRVAAFADHWRSRDSYKKVLENTNELIKKMRAKQ